MVPRMTRNLMERLTDPKEAGLYDKHSQKWTPGYGLTGRYARQYSGLENIKMQHKNFSYYAGLFYIMGRYNCAV